jgi:galacturonokinase
MVGDIEKRRESLLHAHQAAFGSRASDVRFVSAPYRICPLGAHVDHQLGLVTGLTVDSGVLLAFTPSTRASVRLASRNFTGSVEFHLHDIPAAANGDWGNYARGAALALQSSQAIPTGFDGVIDGNLPSGGIGSSAAAGLAYLIAFEAVNGLQVLPEENIRLDQFIENRYIGLNNGILDQSVILLTKERCLLQLDCQSGDHQSIASPSADSQLELIVVYSGLSRALAATDYNRRVSECEEAARRLLQEAGCPALERPVLRNVSREIFDAYAQRLPDAPRKRAQHFFDESARVPLGVDAWRKGDFARLGELISASGESSIRNYESGAPHLITLHRMLSNMPGVYGARFSGAGFRGNAVAFAHPDARDEVQRRIQEEYPRAHPDTANTFSIHFCRLGSGATLQ